MPQSAAAAPAGNRGPTRLHPYQTLAAWRTLTAAGMLRNRSAIRLRNQHARPQWLAGGEGQKRDR